MIYFVLSTINELSSQQTSTPKRKAQYSSHKNTDKKSESFKRVKKNAIRMKCMKNIENFLSFSRLNRTRQKLHVNTGSFINDNARLNDEMTAFFVLKK